MKRLFITFWDVLDSTPDVIAAKMNDKIIRDGYATVNEFLDILADNEPSLREEVCRLKMRSLNKSYDERGWAFKDDRGWAFKPKHFLDEIEDEINFDVGTILSIDKGLRKILLVENGKAALPTLFY